MCGSVEMHCTVYALSLISVNIWKMGFIQCRRVMNTYLSLLSCLIHICSKGVLLMLRKKFTLLLHKLFPVGYTAKWWSFKVEPYSFICEVIAWQWFTDEKNRDDEDDLKFHADMLFYKQQYEKALDSYSDLLKCKHTFHPFPVKRTFFLFSIFYICYSFLLLYPYFILYSSWIHVNFNVTPAPIGTLMLI